MHSYSRLLTHGKFLAGRFTASALGLVFKRSSRSTAARLGSRYGGWICALDSLRPDGYALCAGAGEDISFDVELVARFGMNVVCVDPTPRSIRHVEQLEDHYDLDEFDPQRFRFLPVALWREDGVIRLYEPKDPNHVSHSALNLQNTRGFIEVPSLRIATMLKQLSLEDLELLKLDIEGAECAVLEDMLDADVRPAQILVEFDALYSFRPDAIWNVMRCMWRLSDAGYRLTHVEGANFSFERGH